MLMRIAKEPPFRLLARTIVLHLPFSIQTKGLWDTVARPNYLTGVLHAANQAKEEGVPEISVIEFGVAGGNGLVALQDYAAAVEKESGIKISVWGFDTGKGLSQACGDYRDHPDRYVPGEYVMDEKALTQQLHPRTKLILGDVSQTVVTFVGGASYPPVGFVSIDLDLYSSSKAALQLLSLSGKRTLRRVALYFDDISSNVHHSWAGELLAIREFNDDSATIKIDRWRGLECGRPFPEHDWLKSMYIAHDLVALSSIASSRRIRQLPLTRA